MRGIGFILLAVACSSPAKSGRQSGTGGEPEDGSGGSPATGGKSGGATGGKSGGSTGGSMGSTGGSGPVVDAAPPVDAPAASGGSGGAPGTGGAGGGPVNATCNYTPKANATQVTLKFDPIPISGVSTADISKDSGTKDGFTDFRFVPGKSTDLLLIQKRGKLNHLRLDAAGNAATLVKAYDIPGVFFNQDCGLISVEFDPDHATNKFIYVGYCTAANASKLVRYKWDADALTDPVDIMTWQAGGGRPAYHAIGSIGFEPGGILWVFHGEFEDSAQAQSGTSNLGKLLRLIPSRAAGMGGYMPAADNPYAAEAKPRSAIWASGFRSPWRGLRTAKGQYVIGDVQDQTNEEVNIVTAKGQNFGWPGASGPCTGNCTAPATYYRGSHDPYEGTGIAVKEARVGRSVWVGAQYGDCGNDRYNGALTGVVTFGDYYAGWFRGLVLDDAGKVTKDAKLGDQGGVSAMHQRDDGYLYVLSLGPYGTAAGEKAVLLRASPQ
jgi:hypothetical protein